MRGTVIKRMCAAALLIAMGIVIPMFSPVRYVVEPMSFTLASHVATFVAMFISPPVAVAVALGTSLGFIPGFPPVVVFRAASHVIFALAGSLYIARRPGLLYKPVGLQVFSFGIALVHALCEVVVVSVFYFGGSYPEQEPVRLLLLLVGLGTVVHSMIDFVIASLIVRILAKQKSARGLFSPEVLTSRTS